MDKDRPGIADQLNSGFNDPYGVAKTEIERIGQEEARRNIERRPSKRGETSSSLEGIVTLGVLIGIPLVTWWVLSKG